MAGKNQLTTYPGGVTKPDNLPRKERKMEYQNYINKLTELRDNPPRSDGTYTLIVYEEWGWSEEVTVTLETQSNGDVQATGSDFDEALLFDSYDSAWYDLCQIEIAKLSKSEELAELGRM